MVDLQQISIDSFPLRTFTEKNIVVDVLRVDKIHPIISGNKYFKFLGYLNQVKEENKKGIITFGGAWSNHIHATAFACKALSLQSIGIIRGERSSNLSTTLSDAEKWGMQLFFVDRHNYSEKIIPTALEHQMNNFIIVPEGGFGKTGTLGFKEMFNDLDISTYSNIACAVGTGTMLAGIINHFAEKKIIGISVLKNNLSIADEVKSLLINPATNYEILHDYHFGGYAKLNGSLIDKMNEFYHISSIPTDRVYTAKLFAAMEDLASKNYFPNGSRILLIHSGGLQGNSSLPKGTLIF